jgi:DNA helicase-2/ATP-dependent DNA helicase PcrA
MKFYGDFHLHSYLSRATSKNLTLEYLESWAKIKGITVVGTADITHPEWLAEMQKKLEPAEPGLFTLKKEYSLPIEFGFKNSKSPDSLQNREVRFILTGEISNIYKQDEKTRKARNLIFLPDFESVEKFQNTLKHQNTNITSDGCPNLKTRVRDTLETMLSINSDSFLVPTDIWTHKGALLGPPSGFERIPDAFGDLAPHIKAIEIGIGSDPPMNWMCSHLDQYTLTANSDAHSPEKLGRNANIFNTELSFNHIIQAMSDGNGKTFEGTINLYPQDGKYHSDGHRKCNILWSPLETLKHNGICTECGKPVTIGIVNRIAELSDRESITERPQRLPFFPIIPLREIIAEILQVGESSQKVTKAYQETIQKLGPELDILLNVNVEEMDTVNNLLGEAIRRMRNREVQISPGYDGEYGVIKVFQEQEKTHLGSQNSLFETKRENTDALIHPLIDFDLSKYQELKNFQKKTQTYREPKEKNTTTKTSALTPEQNQAAQHKNGPCIIVGGPGTGKTRVLIHRIKNLEQSGIKPENIIAITETNQAARSMQKQIQTLQNGLHLHSPDLIPTICTFQSLGLQILKQYPHSQKRTSHFSIINEDEKQNILKTHLHIQESDLMYWSQQISNAKQNQIYEHDIDDLEFKTIFEKYEFILQNLNVFDTDDLLYKTIDILQNNEEIQQEYQKKWKYWLIEGLKESHSIQYNIIRTLCPQKNANLCIIGNSQIIKKVKKEYPNITKYKLTHSHRCPETVLNAWANVLNYPRIPGNRPSVKINLTQTQNDEEEAKYIVQKIRELIGGKSFWSLEHNVETAETHTLVQDVQDIAILIRKESQRPILEQTLTKNHIPFQSIAKIPFYQHKPISTILDIFKFIQNEKNIFLQKKITLYKDRLYTIKQKSTVAQTLSHIVLMLFRKENEIHKESIQRLIHLAEEFGNKSQEFIDYIDLGQGADTYQKNKSVTIITLPQSKEFEFPAVFIAGCEEGILPDQNAQTNIKQERQLFSLGMTRTQKILFLSYANNREVNGYRHEQKPSRFLDKIPPHLIEDHQEQTTPIQKPTGEKASNETLIKKTAPQKVWFLYISSFIIGSRS